jgi:hypothetical protein
MAGGARFIRADRSQTRWDLVDLEALLPGDHRARIVMSFMERLDLLALYDAIKSREGERGRPAADPAVLLGLWLYATIEGVGSARQLERLTERDVTYRWIAGGVPVNYHEAERRCRNAMLLFWIYAAVMGLSLGASSWCTPGPRLRGCSLSRRRPSARSVSMATPRSPTCRAWARSF